MIYAARRFGVQTSGGPSRAFSPAPPPGPSARRRPGRPRASALAAGLPARKSPACRSGRKRSARSSGSSVERRLPRTTPRMITQRRTGPAQQLTGPPLGDPVSVREVAGNSTLLRGGHHLFWRHPGASACPGEARDQDLETLDLSIQFAAATCVIDLARVVSVPPAIIRIIDNTQFAADVGDHEPLDRCKRKREKT